MGKDDMCVHSPYLALFAARECESTGGKMR